MKPSGFGAFPQQSKQKPCSLQMSGILHFSTRCHGGGKAGGALVNFQTSRAVSCCGLHVGTTSPGYKWSKRLQKAHANVKHGGVDSVGSIFTQPTCSPLLLRCPPTPRTLG